jgi:hypothetical protein
MEGSLLLNIEVTGRLDYDASFRRMYQDASLYPRHRR